MRSELNVTDVTDDEENKSFPILEEIFGTSASLAEAWERHPLLATSYTVNGPSSRAKNDLTIPTVWTAKYTASGLINAPINIGDIDTVLSQPNLVHGTDYIVGKRVVRDGEEWLGMIPKDTISVDEAHVAFNHHGFSLVVNKLERRWRPVAELARLLEKETLPRTVTCNLYLTPEPKAAQLGVADSATHVGGFEVHFDWMDVIVLQISGEKLWSVASSPLVYLSTPDLKYKPSSAEIEMYMRSCSKDEPCQNKIERRRYHDFLLRPGDALYIPRGFLHNASNVGATAVGALTESVEDRTPGPSLHVTFGFEHHCETTVEALVHDALLLYALEKGNHRTAIPQPSCEGLDRDVSWVELLHFSLAAVGRRQCTGNPHLHGHSGNYEMNYSKESTKDEWLEKACRLRGSVPLHPAWIEIRNGRHRTEASSAVQSFSTRTVSDFVMSTYMNGLDAWKHLSGVSEIVAFVAHVRSDHNTVFCFPGMKKETNSIFGCESALSSMSNDSLHEELDKFLEFAKVNFVSSLDFFRKRVDQSRARFRADQEQALNAVGQTAK